MGRGVAYPYEHFMLFDDDEWEVWDVEEFQEQVRKAFRADETEQWPYRDAKYFGETDRLYVGVDYGGGSPCIFAVPKTYETGGGWDKEYKIYRDVRDAFNRLCREYPELFSRATSAWTSEPIGKRYAL